MADYHPLIARAVAGLEKNTGENRRALYERARTALVAQLRGVVPALDESEITRERLALEEAIRKVEAEVSAACARSGTPDLHQAGRDSAARGINPNTAAGSARATAQASRDISGRSARAAASGAATNSAYAQRTTVTGRSLCILPPSSSVSGRHWNRTVRQSHLADVAG